MPKTSGAACVAGPSRDSLPSHEFAGAAEWVLRIIGIDSMDDPSVDPEALARGIAGARSMLERAASLELSQQDSVLRVRVVNETGHKLPTGHIEGRRAWVNVKLYAADDGLLEEYGGYDASSGELDTASTTVYEMQVGLSDDAARVVVSVNYQVVTREYIEALRNGNSTDDRGEHLHDLWLLADQAPPFVMVERELPIVLD